MQNFDKLQYINTLYPWDGKERLRPPLSQWKIIQ